MNESQQFDCDVTKWTINKLTVMKLSEQSTIWLWSDEMTVDNFTVRWRKDSQQIDFEVIKTSRPFYYEVTKRQLTILNMN